MKKAARRGGGGGGEWVGRADNPDQHSCNRRRGGDRRI